MVIKSAKVILYVIKILILLFVYEILNFFMVLIYFEVITNGVVDIEQETLAITY